MNKIFLASAFALATLTANVAAAQAETIVVRTDNRMEHRRDMHRMPQKHCVTKKTVRWHHGKKIVTEKRICR